MTMLGRRRCRRHLSFLPCLFLNRINDAFVRIGEQMSTVTMLMQLGKGMISTAEIFFLTLLFSLPLGLVIAFGRMSKRGLVRGISKFYISIMRGTPLMLQLLVVYFAPYYLFGLNLRGYRFPAIILAFSINYAAYFAEIYRGGIESMAIGQYEAAKVLGYNRAQTFFKIILPQVIKRILPAITNETININKLLVVMESGKPMTATEIIEKLGIKSKVIVLI